MRVQIKHDDGSKTSYFGISDFHVGEDQITLHFLSDVSTDTPQRAVEGSVISCVAESAYNETGADEVIRHEATDSDSRVIVGVSHHYPDVSSAAVRLAGDERFDNDLEVLR